MEVAVVKQLVKREALRLKCHATESGRCTCPRELRDVDRVCADLFTPSYKVGRVVVTFLILQSLGRSITSPRSKPGREASSGHLGSWCGARGDRSSMLSPGTLYMRGSQKNSRTILGQMRHRVSELRSGDSLDAMGPMLSTLMGCWIDLETSLGSLDRVIFHL